jgi:hypothetical protein
LTTGSCCTLTGLIVLNFVTCQMTFEEYLHEKMIDSEEFKRRDEGRWHAWEAEFNAMSEASFTAQKLYLINPLRRRFHLKPENVKDETHHDKPKPTAARPKMR